MERPIGFLVWCPEAEFPRVVHDTLERALTEAERLGRVHPSHRFVVMAPVLTAQDAHRAKAWSDGKAEGLAQAHREIMHAEAKADRLLDERHEREQGARRLRVFDQKRRACQAIVADALLWFDGFAAAHAHKESWEQPRIPDRDQLRELNGALLDLDGIANRRGNEPDDGIPF